MRPIVLILLLVCLAAVGVAVVATVVIRPYARRAWSKVKRAVEDEDRSATLKRTLQMLDDGQTPTY
jgi:hypothetical protein